MESGISISADGRLDTPSEVLDSFSRTLLAAERTDTVIVDLAAALGVLSGRCAMPFGLDRERNRLLPLSSFSGPEMLPPRLEGISPSEICEPVELDLRPPPSESPWLEFFELNQSALTRAAARTIYFLPVSGIPLGLIILGPGRKVLSRQAAGAIRLALRQALLCLARLEAAETLRRSSFENRLKLLEIQTLRDVGIAIASILDLGKLSLELLSRTVALMNVNRAAVLIGPESHGVLAAESEAGPGELTVWESFNLNARQRAALEKLVRGGYAAALSAGTLVQVNDTNYVPVELGCGKLLIAPATHQGKLLGVILVADKEGRHDSFPDFDEEDGGLLCAIANFAGAAISNARLYRSVVEIKNYNENILASIASGVITTDSAGRIVSFNSSAAGIFSLAGAAAVGLDIGELFARVGCTDLAARLRPTLARGVPCQETNFYGRNSEGRRIVFNVSATALVDEEGGASRGMVVSVENISEGARIREMLQRYVSAPVAELALQEGRELVLGGELRDVTVLFADIREFTTLSEDSPPEKVVELLNQFFDLMIGVAFRMRGTVDKIVGDEIMVLFGAPFNFEDDTRRAVRCALEMLKELEGFNRGRRRKGLAPLNVGIGINRGPVISGNIGSTRRMDYTVIGDAVNLASRLVDSAAGGQVLISRSVAAQLDESFELVAKGRLKVKGRREPAEVFAVLGGPSD